MRLIEKRLLTVVGALLLAACAAEPQVEQNVRAEPMEGTKVIPEPSGPPVVQQADPAAPSADGEAVRWTYEGNVLRLLGPGRSLLMVLGCRQPGRQLLVHVPSFTPIASEDRLSLGLGEEPVTLVADLAPRSGNLGIIATGESPGNLEALLVGARQITALYGTQRAGPYPSLSADVASSFARTC